MATYTAGTVDDLNYVAEVTYGTTPTDALSWAGDVLSITPSIDFDKQFVIAGGSRAFTSATKGPETVGFKVDCYARAVDTATYWSAFWATYALGAETAVADTLGSFSLLLGLTQSTSHFYHLVNGCKMNSLTIQADKPGHPVHFIGDIWAQHVDSETDKNFTGLQTVTVGANASDRTTNLVTFSGATTINIAAAGATTIYPTKWALTINNNLTREYGSKAGADSANYELAIALTEGVRDIELDMTLPYANQTYADAKLAGSAVTAVTIALGGRTITLGTGEFVANDMPEWKQSAMEESVKMKFKTITLA